MANIRFNGQMMYVNGSAKVYGNQRTGLKLSEAAERAYSNIDPLTIYEVTTDEGHTEYWIDGAILSGPLTAEGVNAALVSFAEED